MIQPLSGNAPAATAAASGRKDDPAKIQEAAVQFEALLLTTLLRSAKGGESGGWTGSGEDQSLAPAVGMAEEQLAATIAHQGGLGLSKVIFEQLHRPQTPSPSPDLSHPSKS